jgi:hypothetical protein
MPEHQIEGPLAERRKAVAELGAAMRAATIALVESEAPIEDLAAAAVRAREIAETLSRVRRPATQEAAVDDWIGGIRHFTPVSGLGTPLSVPLVYDYEGDTVVARGTFDRRFEGPPGKVHGGVTALVFDDVLSRAAKRIGRWGMTAFLNTTYRRGLPLGVELEFRSWVGSIDGRKTAVEGTAALAGDPSTVHVEAAGLFVEPRTELQQDYFGDFTDAKGVPIPRRHAPA